VNQDNYLNSLAFEVCPYRTENPRVHSSILCLGIRKDKDLTIAGKSFFFGSHGVHWSKTNAGNGQRMLIAIGSDTSQQR